MKKTLAILLALVMIMSLATTAFAQEVDTGDGSATITISNAAVGETYKVIKLFDATVGTNTITYTGTIPSGLENYFESTDAGITVKDAAKGTDGKLSEDAVKAIKAWAEAQTTVTASATATEANLVFTGLEYGYYVVTTTQGTVITVTSTNPTASVTDKNTAPTVNKEITGASSYDEDGKKALAQVGTDVTYTATITVGTGAKNYVYHDTMDSTLSFNGADSVTVTINDSTTNVPAKNDDETVNYTVNVPGTDSETFTVAFDDTYIASLDAGDTITITYTAKVTSDALTEDPANNTAYVTYGDKGKTTESKTEVYNAKFTVSKTDASGNPLAGAGFVIKNSENKYYKLVEGAVTWVDSIDDADEHTSDGNGDVDSFTGLANGTYTLIEKTVPAGYNKAADSTFTIAEHNYVKTNLEQSTTVENKSGTELPSTGGIGTTLFYVFGGLMVAGAAILLVTKKRMSVAE